ncbi:putative alpha-farnesene synthase [Helianthus anomalus]
MASIIYASQSTPKAKGAKLVARRSGNYAPSIWSFDFLQSLSSEYTVRLQIYFHLLTVALVYNRVNCQNRP